MRLTFDFAQPTLKIVHCPGTHGVNRGGVSSATGSNLVISGNDTIQPLLLPRRRSFCYLLSVAKIRSLRRFRSFTITLQGKTTLDLKHTVGNPVWSSPNRLIQSLEFPGI
jgi:hypothetical protein